MFDFISSNSQVKSASRKSLNRGGRGFDPVLGVKALLRLPLNLLAALLLIVFAFHVLQLASQPLDLVLVLIHLSLIHVEFSGHGLHLAGLFLEILLVDAKLFGHFGSRLSGQKIFQLNVQFFFLLDDNILFDNLFGFFDQTLLQSLDLLEHFPGVWVGALEFAPSVIV